MADFNGPVHNVRTPSQQQPKQMSSRLLNMKFMQRASATSTPTSSTVQTPTTEPLAKRRRIESATSSPSMSMPGTPVDGASNLGLALPTTARGGISTFMRSDGADSEWVLDVKAPDADLKRGTSMTNLNSKRANGNASHFGALAEVGAHTEVEVEEENVWNSGQSSGRQMFGSFKRKRKSRTKTDPEQTHDGGDLDSKSESEDESGSDADSGSDASTDSCTAHRRKTPTTQRNGISKSTKDLESDEEMRQVRRAIEQKHRSMMGGAKTVPRSNNNNISRLPVTGGFDGRPPWPQGSETGKGRKIPRRRDEGSYKKKKRARKTI